MRVFQPKFVPVEYEELIIHRIEEEFYQSDCFHACFTLWKKRYIIVRAVRMMCSQRQTVLYLIRYKADMPIPTTAQQTIIQQETM